MYNSESDYARIEDAIRCIEARFPETASLDELAAAAGLSAPHFQRVFRRWIGISPKGFQQFLTVEYAKQRLVQSHRVLDAAYDAGLSGPGRLHDLFVSCEAMTPGEYKSQARDMVVRYGFHRSPFGECLLMTMEPGICALGFTAKEGEARSAPGGPRRPRRSMVVRTPCRGSRGDRASGGADFRGAGFGGTTHASSQGHQSSDQGLGSVAAHPDGPPCDLPGPCVPRRQTRGRTRRRQRRRS
jgi:AraC-like DNA-binding protein